MNFQGRFRFEKRKKHFCPNCGQKRFVRYVDIETEEYLPSDYGKCDRVDNCSYWLDPYKSGYAKELWRNEMSTQQTTQTRKYQITPKTPKIKELVPIPYHILKATRKAYAQNQFIQNLTNHMEYPLGTQELAKVIELYHLGTISKRYMQGATTFPFIDKAGFVRAIQVKQFNKTNHTTKTSFLHSILAKDYQHKNQELPNWLKGYLENETKVSCLFGEHLLKQYPHNPIALVEAPKTAIYGTLYFGFPELTKNLLWLATYNLTSLTLDRCKVLQDRDVYLFPDLSSKGNAFKLWVDRATQFNQELPNTYFMVSDLLEKVAKTTHRKQGLDLADYLIQLDWRKFRSAKSEKGDGVVKTFSEFYYENGVLMRDGYPSGWDLM